MLKYIIIADAKKIDYFEILQSFDLKQFAIIIAENQLNAVQQQHYAKFFGKLILIDNWGNKLSIWNEAVKLLTAANIIKIAALNEEDLLLASALREHFKLDGMNYAQTMCFRDKVKMKQTAEANGVVVPFFAAVDNFLDIYNFLDKYGYNAILKPRDSHSSQGLYFIKSKQDAEQIVQAKAVAGGFSGMIIETIVDGPMFQVDGLIKNGELDLAWPSVSINQWSDINSGTIVGRHFIDPKNALLASLQTYTQKVIQAFPMPKNGVFQVEFFKDSQTGEFIFCEIAARVCGARGREAWQQSFNIDLTKESILQQLELPSGQEYLKTPPNLAGYFLLPLSQKPLPTSMPVEVLEYFVPEKPTTYGGLVFFAGKNQEDCLRITNAIQNWYNQL